MGFSKGVEKEKESIQKQYDFEQEEYIQTKAKQRLEEQLQKISQKNNDDDDPQYQSSCVEQSSNDCEQDGQFDDARMAISLGHTIEKNGGTVMNYLKWESFSYENDIVSGIKATDQITNITLTCASAFSFFFVSLFTAFSLFPSFSSSLPLYCLSLTL